MPAGGLTLRFLANRRSYRPRHSLHRRLAGPARPAAGQDSRTRCGCTATERRAPGRYAALQKAPDGRFRPGEARQLFLPVRCHIRDCRSVYRVALAPAVGLSCRPARIIWLRGSMETLLLPFSPRYIVLTICAVVTALLIGIGIFDHNPKVWEILLIPIVIFGALTLLGIRDLTAEEPRGSAQLSDLGAYPFPARGDPPGDAAVLLREREGRHAVLPRHPRAGLSARQDAARQAAVRHPGRRLSRGLRMDAPFGGAEGAQRRENSASPSAARIAPSRIRHRSSTSRR